MSHAAQEITTHARGGIASSASLARSFLAPPAADGYTLRGIGVISKRDNNLETYATQIKGGSVCSVFDRGVRKQQACVWADGTCDYTNEDCAKNHARLLAMIAHVAPVEALANAAAEAVEPMRRARRDSVPCAIPAPCIIIREGCTLQGISVSGRGVFTDMDGRTYTGQVTGGYACGLGVLTGRDGTRSYSEHGRDGWCERSLARNGSTSYFLVCGEQQHRLLVSADGFCMYNWDSCAHDDPRSLALIARVAPVEALASAAAKDAEAAVGALPRRLLGLHLMMTVMLARHREPTIVSELAAGLLALPSGLLAMVCEAIVR
jgi:hypothetical protein